jgi:DNA invertase Pin-like site-specific DNA recombinase
LGDGDTFIVTRLDRLGRSLRDLANVAHEIEEAGDNVMLSLGYGCGLRADRPSQSRRHR